MKIDYLMLGEKLKQQRKKQGITQETLAEYVDLSVSHLSHIENGSTKVSLQTIVNIANILNISLDELLDLDLGKRSMFITVREIDLLFKRYVKSFVVLPNATLTCSLVRLFIKSSKLIVI